MDNNEKRLTQLPPSANALHHKPKSSGQGDELRTPDIQGEKLCTTAMEGDTICSTAIQGDKLCPPISNKEKLEALLSDSKFQKRFERLKKCHGSKTNSSPSSNNTQNEYDLHGPQVNIRDKFRIKSSRMSALACGDTTTNTTTTTTNGIDKYVVDKYKGTVDDCGDESTDDVEINDYELIADGGGGGCSDAGGGAYGALNRQTSQKSRRYVGPPGLKNGVHGNDQKSVSLKYPTYNRISSDKERDDFSYKSLIMDEDDSSLNYNSTCYYESRECYDNIKYVDEDQVVSPKSRLFPRRQWLTGSDVDERKLTIIKSSASNSSSPMKKSVDDSDDAVANVICDDMECYRELSESRLCDANERFSSQPSLTSSWSSLAPSMGVQSRERCRTTDQRSSTIAEVDGEKENHVEMSACVESKSLSRNHDNSIRDHLLSEFFDSRESNTHIQTADNDTETRASNETEIRAGNGTETIAGNETEIRAGNGTETIAGNETETKAGYGTEERASNGTETEISHDIVINKSEDEQTNSGIHYEPNKTSENNDNSEQNVITKDAGHPKSVLIEANSMDSLYRCDHVSKDTGPTAMNYDESYGNKTVDIGEGANESGYDTFTIERSYFEDKRELAMSHQVENSSDNNTLHNHYSSSDVVKGYDKEDSDGQQKMKLKGCISKVVVDYVPTHDESTPQTRLENDNCKKNSPPSPSSYCQSNDNDNVTHISTSNASIAECHSSIMEGISDQSQNANLLASGSNIIISLTENSTTLAKSKNPNLTDNDDNLSNMENYSRNAEQNDTTFSKENNSTISDESKLDSRLTSNENTVKQLETNRIYADRGSGSGNSTIPGSSLDHDIKANTKSAENIFSWPVLIPKNFTMSHCHTYDADSDSNKRDTNKDLTRAPPRVTHYKYYYQHGDSSTGNETENEKTLCQDKDSNNGQVNGPISKNENQNDNSLTAETDTQVSETVDNIGLKDNESSSSSGGKIGVLQNDMETELHDNDIIPLKAESHYDNHHVNMNSDTEIATKRSTNHNDIVIEDGFDIDKLRSAFKFGDSGSSYSPEKGEIKLSHNKQRVDKCNISIKDKIISQETKSESDKANSTLSTRPPSGKFKHRNNNDRKSYERDEDDSAASGARNSSFINNDDDDDDDDDDDGDDDRHNDDGDDDRHNDDDDDDRDNDDGDGDEKDNDKDTNERSMCDSNKTDETNEQDSILGNVLISQTKMDDTETIDVNSLNNRCKSVNYKKCDGHEEEEGREGEEDEKQQQLQLQNQEEEGEEEDYSADEDERGRNHGYGDVTDVLKLKEEEIERYPNRIEWGVRAGGDVGVDGIAYDFLKTNSPLTCASTPYSNPGLTPIPLEQSDERETNSTTLSPYQNHFCSEQPGTFNPIDDDNNLKYTHGTHNVDIIATDPIISQNYTDETIMHIPTNSLSNPKPTRETDMNIATNYLTSPKYTQKTDIDNATNSLTHETDMDIPTNYETLGDEISVEYQPLLLSNQRTTPAMVEDNETFEYNTTPESTSLHGKTFDVESDASLPPHLPRSSSPITTVGSELHQTGTPDSKTDDVGINVHNDSKRNGFSKLPYSPIVPIGDKCAADKRIESMCTRSNHQSIEHPLVTSTSAHGRTNDTTTITKNAPHYSNETQIIEEVEKINYPDLRKKVDEFTKEAYVRRVQDFNESKATVGSRNNITSLEPSREISKESDLYSTINDKGPTKPNYNGKVEHDDSSSNLPSFLTGSSIKISRKPPIPIDKKVSKPPQNIKAPPVKRDTQNSTSSHQEKDTRIPTGPNDKPINNSMPNSNRGKFQNDSQKSNSSFTSQQRKYIINDEGNTRATKVEPSTKFVKAGIPWSSAAINNGQKHTASLNRPNLEQQTPKNVISNKTRSKIPTLMLQKRTVAPPPQTKQRSLIPRPTKTPNFDPIPKKPIAEKNMKPPIAVKNKNMKTPIAVKNKIMKTPSIVSNNATEDTSKIQSPNRDRITGWCDTNNSEEFDDSTKTDNPVFPHQEKSGNYANARLINRRDKMEKNEIDISENTNFRYADNFKHPERGHSGTYSAMSSSKTSSSAPLKLKDSDVSDEGFSYSSVVNIHKGSDNVSTMYDCKSNINDSVRLEDWHNSNECRDQEYDNSSPSTYHKSRGGKSKRCGISMLENQEFWQHKMRSVDSEGGPISLNHHPKKEDEDMATHNYRSLIHEAIFKARSEADAYRGAWYAEENSRSCNPNNVRKIKDERRGSSSPYCTSSSNKTVHLPAIQHNMQQVRRTKNNSNVLSNENQNNSCTNHDGDDDYYDNLNDDENSYNTVGNTLHANDSIFQQDEFITCSSYTYNNNSHFGKPSLPKYRRNIARGKSKIPVWVRKHYRRNEWINNEDSNNNTKHSNNDNDINHLSHGDTQLRRPMNDGGGLGNTENYNENEHFDQDIHEYRPSSMALNYELQTTEEVPDNCDNEKSHAGFLSRHESLLGRDSATPHIHHNNNDGDGDACDTSCCVYYAFSDTPIQYEEDLIVPRDQGITGWTDGITENTVNDLYHDDSTLLEQHFSHTQINHHDHIDEFQFMVYDSNQHDQMDEFQSMNYHLNQQDQMDESQPMNFDLNQQNDEFHSMNYDLSQQMDESQSMNYDSVDSDLVNSRVVPEDVNDIRSSSVFKCDDSMKCTGESHFCEESYCTEECLDVNYNEFHERRTPSQSRMSNYVLSRMSRMSKDAVESIKSEHGFFQLDESVDEPDPSFLEIIHRRIAEIHDIYERVDPFKNVQLQANSIDSDGEEITPARDMRFSSKCENNDSHRCSPLRLKLKLEMNVVNNLDEYVDGQSSIGVGKRSGSPDCDSYAVQSGHRSHQSFFETAQQSNSYRQATAAFDPCHHHNENIGVSLPHGSMSLAAWLSPIKSEYSPEFSRRPRFRGDLGKSIVFSSPEIGSESAANVRADSKNNENCQSAPCSLTENVDPAFRDTTGLEKRLTPQNAKINTSSRLKNRSSSKISSADKCEDACGNKDYQNRSSEHLSSSTRKENIHDCHNIEPSNTGIIHESSSACADESLTIMDDYPTLIARKESSHVGAQTHNALVRYKNNTNRYKVIVDKPTTKHVHFKKGSLTFCKDPPLQVPVFESSSETESAGSVSSSALSCDSIGRSTECREGDFNDTDNDNDADDNHHHHHCGGDDLIDFIYGDDNDAIFDLAHKNCIPKKKLTGHQNDCDVKSSLNDYEYEETDESDNDVEEDNHGVTMVTKESQSRVPLSQNSDIILPKKEVGGAISTDCSSSVQGFISYTTVSATTTDAAISPILDNPTHITVTETKFQQETSSPPCVESSLNTVGAPSINQELLRPLSQPKATKTCSKFSHDETGSPAKTRSPKKTISLVVTGSPEDTISTAGTKFQIETLSSRVAKSLYETNSRVGTKSQMETISRPVTKTPTKIVSHIVVPKETVSRHITKTPTETVSRVAHKETVSRPVTKTPTETVSCVVPKETVSRHITKTPTETVSCVVPKETVSRPVTKTPTERVSRVAPKETVSSPVTKTPTETVSHVAPKENVSRPVTKTPTETVSHVAPKETVSRVGTKSPIDTFCLSGTHSIMTTKTSTKKNSNNTSAVVDSIIARRGANKYDISPTGTLLNQQPPAMSTVRTDGTNRNSDRHIIRNSKNNDTGTNRKSSNRSAKGSKNVEDDIKITPEPLPPLSKRQAGQPHRANMWKRYY